MRGAKRTPSQSLVSNSRSMIYMRRVVPTPTRTPKRSVHSTPCDTVAWRRSIHRALSSSKCVRFAGPYAPSVANHAHAHQGGAVAVERDHLQVRPRQREAERQGVTHPIDPTRYNWFSRSSMA